ncbi:hypothetical protein KSP39_PZI002580 [Platanthera zijinensis]|uniref:Uncharacterized protein n=1 Tax=Platanthera zijinensis TaxID=2320716 RepID=A0AAP0GEK4_9ASPA
MTYQKPTFSPPPSPKRKVSPSKESKILPSKKPAQIKQVDSKGKRVIYSDKSSKKFAEVVPPSSLVIQEDIEPAAGLLDLSTKFKTIKPLDPADENAYESKELNPEFRMARFLELV